MSGRPTKEADLFQAVHDLFWQQGSGERRDGPRHPYKCSQLLAPCHHGFRMPRQTDFSWVECKNLSARGFSFFWPEEPTFKHVVVALGGVPFIFLLARVVHVSVEGEHFLCGCHFQKRLSRTLDNAGLDAKKSVELDRSVLAALVPQTAANAAKTESADLRVKD
jgi:hypothetical protein